MLAKCNSECRRRQSRGFGGFSTQPGLEPGPVLRTAGVIPGLESGAPSEPERPDSQWNLPLRRGHVYCSDQPHPGRYRMFSKPLAVGVLARWRA